MGPWRLSPGTKGPGGYRQGPRGPAAIAGDQGARRLSPGTWGLGLMGPSGYRRGPGGPASIPGVDKALINPKIIHQPHLSAGLILWAPNSMEFHGITWIPKILMYSLDFQWIPRADLFLSGVDG